VQIDTSRGVKFGSEIQRWTVLPGTESRTVLERFAKVLVSVAMGMGRIYYNP
jgi:hypothetical protein